MNVAALILYVLAFLLELFGAIGVIQDVRTSIGNMRQLKSDLTDAEAAADEHRRQIEKVRNKARDPRFQQAMDQLAGVAQERFVDQTGPAAAIQRRALVTYVTAQNNISDLRRWGAVALLLLGLGLGFLGNVVALHPL